MEAAQYLSTLLTDQHQNFTKWLLFGHTLQDSDHGGQPPFGHNITKWRLLNIHVKYVQTALT